MSQDVDHWISRVDWSIKHPASKLTHQVLDMRGFGTPKVLHLLNNLCAWQPTRYLEFGTWAGRSLAAAAWDNAGCYLGIENFHVDARINRELAANIQSLPQARVLAMDFRAFKLVDGLWWDVFFYDADHSRASTRDGILAVATSLKSGVLIVDDIELPGYEDQIMPGVIDGLRAGHFQVHRTWTLKKSDGYHEGLWIAVIEGHDAYEVEARQTMDARRAVEHEQRQMDDFKRVWIDQPVASPGETS